MHRRVDLQGNGLRAPAGTVTLNGVAVAVASDFAPNRPLIQAPVSLQVHNTLAVQLQGSPKSQIAVAILPQ